MNYTWGEGVRTLYMASTTWINNHRVHLYYDIIPSEVTWKNNEQSTDKKFWICKLNEQSQVTNVLIGGGIDVSEMGERKKYSSGLFNKQDLFIHPCYKVTDGIMSNTDVKQTEEFSENQLQYRFSFLERHSLNVDLSNACLVCCIPPINLLHNLSKQH